MKGQYLKEVLISFIIDEKLSLLNVESILCRLINNIDMIKNTFSINELPPNGFDILMGLKESHIVFSYWGEYNYVRLNLASCKKYDVEDIIKFLKHNFKIVNKIRVQCITDTNIKEEVEDLCQERY